MRVLHVAPYLPPRPGGVGVWVARLHRALREAGHDSRVWTRGAACARDAEGEVERIASSSAGWLATLAGRARRAAAFDVIHVHAGEALPLLIALRLARRRSRVVATWHVCYAGVARALAPCTLDGRRVGEGGARAAQTLLAWGHRAADRAALHLVDAAVPISRACARELLGAARGAAATVIHHGVAEPGETGVPPPPSVALLYVGGASHRKRVHALPPLLERVRAARPDARLRIVGFAPEAAPDLCRAFAARGLADAVDWAGAVPEEMLPAHYRAADLLVVPSAYEGLPLVVVEAMRCGLPVVATRVGAHAEAIDEGETGHLVPADDPAAMAARCIALLRDGPRRRRLGAAAAVVARERFGMDRHVDAYVALYEQLCGSAA